MTVVQKQATLSKNAGLGQAHPQKQLAVKVLTLSDFRTYIYVRNSQTVATPVRIYTYTDFAIEILGF